MTLAIRSEWAWSMAPPFTHWPIFSLSSSANERGKRSWLTLAVLSFRAFSFVNSSREPVFQIFVFDHFKSVVNSMVLLLDICAVELSWSFDKARCLTLTLQAYDLIFHMAGSARTVDFLSHTRNKLPSHWFFVFDSSRQVLSQLQMSNVVALNWCLKIITTCEW